MKSTELHPTTVRLGAVRWGSFDLRFEGTNTAGAWTGVTLRIDWALWPMVAIAAGLAWVTEQGVRCNEIDIIASTVPQNPVKLANYLDDAEKKRRAA